MSIEVNDPSERKKKKFRKKQKTCGWRKQREVSTKNGLAPALRKRGGRPRKEGEGSAHSIWGENPDDVRERSQEREGGGGD